MFYSHSLLVLATFVFLTRHSLVTSYAVPEKVYYDLEMSQSHFDDFVSKHQKQYTDEEAEYRFQVFQENLHKINKLNQEHESAVFAVNSFSDLTPEEFMATASCLPNATNLEVEPLHFPDIQAPASLDYRKQNLVTEVKNQQRCGSCYIFGAMGDIEGQYAKVHQQLVALSEQYPLDCGEKFSCDGGFPDDVANWLAQTPGAISMQDYPYVGAKSQCRNSGQPVARVTGAQRSSPASTEEIKNILASHGPLATVLFVSPSYQFYTGGVFTPGDCSGQINHAVTLVGYGENYWIIKNSWGAQWGEQGYLLLAFENCNLGFYVFPTQVS